MDTMERDPAYIAQQVKYLRKMNGLTQDNLAAAAGVTPRTIEKVESGRHTPEEQTLRSIARAFNLDVKVFAKPSPADEARVRAEMERALRKIVVVPTQPIRSAGDFLGAFGERDALRFDCSAVKDDQALETAATLGDWLRDLGEVWSDMYMSQRLESARDVLALCNTIESRGYLCHMGHHRQQLRQKDRSPLVFHVGLVTILPKAENDGTRYAVVTLEDGWETIATDRPTVSPA
jgi:transcriptional regulator with XRE-family HTH domain